VTPRASCVYEGLVRHRRLEPIRHELCYPLALLYVDLAELPEVFDGHALWSSRRPAPAWFRRRDYLGPPDVPLDEAVRVLVERRTGARPRGPVRLLSHLRYFGYGFNPVSFYFCFDERGRRVQAVVAEVTNTPWAERHAYVMARPSGSGGRVIAAHVAKSLHVSPFIGMDHEYDWRILEPGDDLIVHIDAVCAGRKTFEATLTLQRRTLDATALRRALWRYPAATVAVTARIYAHALRLKLKGAPVHPHPGAAPG
jgi:uncharacterized protein